MIGLRSNENARYSVKKRKGKDALGWMAGGGSVLICQAICQAHSPGAIARNTSVCLIYKYKYQEIQILLPASFTNTNINNQQLNLALGLNFYGNFDFQLRISLPFLLILVRSGHTMVFLVSSV